MLSADNNSKSWSMVNNDDYYYYHLLCMACMYIGFLWFNHHFRTLLNTIKFHTCSSSLLCFSSLHWQNVGWFQSCTSCLEFRDQEWSCCCQGLWVSLMVTIVPHTCQLSSKVTLSDLYLVPLFFFSFCEIEDSLHLLWWLKFMLLHEYKYVTNKYGN